MTAPVLYALWTGVILNNFFQELPLSFGNLSNLKWLDLKDNPLQNDISKVCGDCSDDKGCRAAATDVVQYMRQKAEERRALLDKQNRLNRRMLLVVKFFPSLLCNFLFQLCLRDRSECREVGKRSSKGKGNEEEKKEVEGEVGSAS